MVESKEAMSTGELIASVLVGELVLPVAESLNSRIKP